VKIFSVSVSDLSLFVRLSKSAAVAAITDDDDDDDGDDGDEACGPLLKAVTSGSSKTHPATAKGELFMYV